VSNLEAKFAELIAQGNALAGEQQKHIEAANAIQAELVGIHHSLKTLKEIDPTLGIKTPVTPEDLASLGALATAPPVVMVSAPAAEAADLTAVDCGFASAHPAEVLAPAAGEVRRLDGRPLERGPDGLIHGEPLRDLTDEQRAALPRLLPHDADAPSVVGQGATPDAAPPADAGEPDSAPAPVDCGFAVESAEPVIPAAPAAPEQPQEPPADEQSANAPAPAEVAVMPSAGLEPGAVEPAQPATAEAVESGDASAADPAVNAAPVEVPTEEAPHEG
jgi:hypothetical protein